MAPSSTLLVATVLGTPAPYAESLTRMDFPKTPCAVMPRTTSLHTRARVMGFTDARSQ